MQTLRQGLSISGFFRGFSTKIRSQLAFVFHTKYKLFFNNRGEFNRCIKLSLFVFSSFRSFVIFLNLGTLAPPATSHLGVPQHFVFRLVARVVRGHPPRKALAGRSL
jgi:hypothetical protein